MIELCNETGQLEICVGVSSIVNKIAYNFVRTDTRECNLAIRLITSFPA
jgi:hypothetical protein